MNNKTMEIARVLCDYLSKLPPDKEAEFFANWTIASVSAQRERRALLQSSLLSGSIGIIGVIVGVMLTKLLQ